jgi:hypothetical protein
MDAFEWAAPLPAPMPCDPLHRYAGLAVPMTNFQNEMDRVVSAFVAQVTDLARRAAVDLLESSLGGTSLTRVRRRAARGVGKRAAADIDRLRDQFVTFVTKNPGLRIEQVNAQLGTTTKDLALPVRKLIADGVIKTKGTRRSTAYFAK